MACKNSGTIIGIYCIENKSNGKVYIGQSIDIHRRWNGHLSELRRNKHKNEKLQNAWNKYGENSFCFRVLEVTTVENLNSAEMYYIALFNSYKQGYNKDTGGCSHKTLSEETRAKISASKKNLSEQARENIRNGSTLSRKILQIDLNGNIVNEWRSSRDASRVLHINQCAIWQCLHHQRRTLHDYIWVFPEEFDSLDISQYQNQNTQSRKVIQKSLDGNILKVWNSASCAASSSLDDGFDSSSIIKCCKGKIKYHKGYIWEYYDKQKCA